jgi:ferric-dicitrate binding protein FerR (iron transport regulator)
MKEEFQHSDKRDTLIIRYLDGYASAEEKQELEAWLSLSEENQQAFEDVQKIWTGSADAGTLAELDVDADWEKVANQFTSQSNAQILSLSTSRWRAIAAAIALVLISSLAWFYLNQSTATYQEIQLTDGTTVWLQPGSTLDYPEQFPGDQRLVTLQGQAFFQVAKNAQKPFIINLDEAQIEVLGTAFNVKTSEEKTEVVVEHGKVKFSEKGDTSNFVLLTQNERGLLSKQKLIEEQNNNPNYLSWKTGNFQFDGQTLPDALEVLNDYYGDQFQFAPGFTSDCQLKANFQQEKTTVILDVLQKSCSVKIQKQNGRYLISN